MRRFAAVAFLFASLAAISIAGGTGTAEGSVHQAVTRLALVYVPTPRLVVPRYDTTGAILQVRGDQVDLGRVNAALRAAVLTDQRRYTPRARDCAIHAGRLCRGTYQTLVDPRLVSASSVVVSALLPAVKLYPCGGEGRTWVAVTVEVPSGRQVRLRDLFRNPSRALPVIARAWKYRFRQTHSAYVWPCVSANPSDFRPAENNYRYFALTPHGLTIGFWDPPACDRLQATLPYRTLRDYLSTRGRRLVAGVRTPR